MSKTHTFIINSITVESKDYEDSLFDILNSSIYNEENGYGFIDVSRDSNLLSGILINRNSTYITDYNYLDNSFQKRQIFLFSRIPFSIDITHKLLIIFGASSLLNQFRIVLQEIWKLKFYLAPIEVNPHKLYLSLQKNDLRFLVDQMSIVNFVYNNGFSGKYTGEVLKQKIVQELFEKYTTDVIKMFVTITIDSEDKFDLQVNSNSSFKISCEEDDLEYYLDYLKPLIAF